MKYWKWMLLTLLIAASAVYAQRRGFGGYGGRGDRYDGYDNPRQIPQQT